MTGPLLVGLVLAMFAGVWTAFGGPFRGYVWLLAVAEAFVVAVSALITSAPEVGSGEALDEALLPYGIAVVAGWAVGGGIGHAFRRLVSS
jgi:hypothetical protein